MWRVFVLALAAVCLLPMSGTQSVSAGEPDRLGDADCSGSVNFDDGLAILVQDAGGELVPCAHLADVQCDVDVDPIDALQLLRLDADLTVEQEPGCGTIGEPPPPSSYDLIAAGLVSGDIPDEETALLYEFYAAFNDPLLPDEYEGADAGVPENPALAKVPGLWDGLSQETRDLILPFLRTPPEPDSWYSQTASPASGPAIQWETVSSASYPVKIWWETRFPADEARAQDFAAKIDSPIWSKLTEEIMGASPIPDCGAGCPSGGGDEKLDVYLVSDVPDANYTQWNPPENPTCENTPAFITLLPSATPSTLTHEFMHAIQFALPYANGDGCDDGWWWEQTATASEDYVWRAQYNSEQHSFAPAFLSTAHKPLEDDSGHREYGAYLFPFYLDRVRGKPGLVGDIFAKMGTEADTLKAIESVVKGGLGDFDEVWRDFALKNWNRPPVENYKDLDSLTYGATPSTQEIRRGEIEIDDADVEHMAAIYAKFTVAANVRTIVFTNTLSGKDHAGVTAIKKVRGEWKDPEDWSDESEKEFCRDRPSEDISELIIIISNADAIGQNALSSDAPTIEGKADGCSGWEGTVTAEGTGHGGAPGTSNGIYTLTTTATINFEQTDDFATVYDLVSGAVRWTAGGARVDSCEGSISGEFNVDFASEFGKEWFFGRLLLDPFDASLYDIYLDTNRPPAIEVWDCEPPDEGFSGEHPWFTRLDVIPNSGENMNLTLTGEPGSRVAQGQFTLTEEYDFEEVTYSWHFVEYGQPE